MYELVRRSSKHYKEIMKGAGYRESLVDPILLLSDLHMFNMAKENADDDFMNLCVLIHRIKELYDSGDERYHAFGNYLREVEDTGFDIKDMLMIQAPDLMKLEDQVELIRMFMSFRYCPDETLPVTH